MKNTTSLKDEIYSSVLESIFRNEFKPNQIINEKDLIQSSGYSKTPVREALIALCNDNVLRNIPRCGYEVVRLTREDVENMLRARYLIEGGSLRMTYDKFTPGQLRRLEQVDDECTKYSTDIWKHWESNTQFHLCLLAPAQNDFVQEILVQTMGRLKRAYSQFFWDRFEEFDLSADTQQHRYIIQALRDRDRDTVMELLKKDMQLFGDIHCALPPYFD